MAASWIVRNVKAAAPRSLANLFSGITRRYEPLSTSGEGLSGPRQPNLERTFWRCLTVLVLVAVLYDILLRTPLETYTKDTVSELLAEPDGVDWSQYAYCQYVTNELYLCNSVMIFASLQELGSKAARIMLYPERWSIDNTTSAGRLLLKARDEFNVELQPIEVLQDGDDTTWGNSFTKLLAFNQTQYRRIISLDSDATVLQSLDELFFLPSAPVAMPRAYWLEDDALKPSTLSSQIIVLEPSEFEFHRLMEAISQRHDRDFDMELLHNLYANDCIIIPHRRFGMLTGEFRKEDHSLYLGSKEEVWDPDIQFNETKFLHFSDWPLPKPWIWFSREDQEEIAPACQKKADGTENCRDREIWFDVYRDFIERRKTICGDEFFVGPSPSADEDDTIEAGN